MRRRTLTAAAVPLAAAALLTVSAGAAHVEGHSMEPALEEGSTVVFERLLAPARGDLVVFDRPDAWDAHDGLLVKRVIGVAGDEVRCCEAGSGRLLVNGIPLPEPYVAAERPGGSSRFTVTVPEGAIWVMGDNRANAGSHDSRDELHGAQHGMITAEHLRGVVRVIL